MCGRTPAAARTLNACGAHAAALLNDEGVEWAASFGRQLIRSLSLRLGGDRHGRRAQLSANVVPSFALLG